MPAFAKRMSQVRRSFIREILKVTADPSIISFAGGLPKPDLFPTGPIAAAAASVLAESGAAALQYSVSEGEPGLRQWIADRYKAKRGMDIDPATVLITNGSQQSLDLLGKVFLDPGDVVAVELPGYIGAIQAFSMFEPTFAGVPLGPEGPDVDRLVDVLTRGQAKMFYAVPKLPESLRPDLFPGRPPGRGRSHARVRRHLCRGRSLRRTAVYGRPPAAGVGLHDPGPLHARHVFQNRRSGPAPGLGGGRSRQPAQTRDRQAGLRSPLLDPGAAHSHALSGRQRPRRPHRHHQGRLRPASAISWSSASRPSSPRACTTPNPKAACFLWVTLPEGCSAFALFDLCIKEKVAFVPGEPFFVDGSGQRTMRLNFSNADPERIVEGIGRMGRALAALLETSSCPAGG